MNKHMTKDGSRLGEGMIQPIMEDFSDRGSGWGRTNDLKELLGAVQKAVPCPSRSHILALCMLHPP